MGVIENIGKFALAPEQVDRDTNQAKLGAGKIGDQEFRPIGRHQGQGIATAIAERRQAMGRPVDPAVEIAVAQSKHVIDDREMVWRPRGTADQ